MTPDEQHAWEVIKALANCRKVEVFCPDEERWCSINQSTFSRMDLDDIIHFPHLYRVAKEGE